MSTMLCKGSVKNVISHYMHEGSSVFCWMPQKLVNRLLDKNFPVHLTRFIISWFKDQHMRVRWGNSFFDVFSVSNGAR